MTDSPTPAEPGPVDPDVELASALLDGEAGPDERARADEPAIEAQRATFASTAERVRDVPPPPAGLLDDQVARAMDAFDDSGTVAPLGRGRSEAPWWQRIPLGAVAAALVVVALVGIASLAGQGSDDDDMATATLESADDSSGDAADGGALGDSGSARADDSAGAMEESAALEQDEGFDADRARRFAYASYDELAADIRDELASTTAASPDEDAAADQQPATTTAPSASEGEAEGSDAPTDPCPAVEVLGIDPARVVLVRSATVGSEAVTAVVHDADDGRRLAVVDDATCTVVLDRLL